jgi:hypothetical protein
VDKATTPGAAYLHFALDSLKDSSLRPNPTTKQHTTTEMERHKAENEAENSNSHMQRLGSP